MKLKIKEKNWYDLTIYEYVDNFLIDFNMLHREAVTWKMEINAQWYIVFKLETKCMIHGF